MILHRFILKSTIIFVLLNRIEGNISEQSGARFYGVLVGHGKWRVS